jgi:hypothetical protein
MLWLLYSKGKSLWYALDRRLGGLQSCSGCGGEEKSWKYNCYMSWRKYHFQNLDTFYVKIYLFNMFSSACNMCSFIDYKLTNHTLMWQV